MSKERTINGQPFTAPTEELEKELVIFCIEQLNLPLGEFWYKWFISGNKEANNHTIHIECNSDTLRETIKAELVKLSFFQKLHEIRLIPYREQYLQDFKYMYFIHIKANKSL